MKEKSFKNNLLDILNEYVYPKSRIIWTDQLAIDFINSILSAIKEALPSEIDLLKILRKVVIENTILFRQEDAIKIVEGILSEVKKNLGISDEGDK